MKRRALIFAAGDGVRWADDKPKQLAQVDGEPILHRTVRQLADRDVEATIVTNNPDLEVAGCGAFKPAKCRWLVETILSSRSLWQGDMIGLLGDVFFTDEAIDAIVEARGLHWFGRKWRSRYTNGPPEIFATTWDVDDGVPTYAMIEALTMAVAEAEEGTPDRDAVCGGMRAPLGSLWQPYRTLIGVPTTSHEFEPEDTVDPIFVTVDDWTDDFDTQPHYENWVARYSARTLVVEENEQWAQFQ